MQLPESRGSPVSLKIVPNESKQNEKHSMNIDITCSGYLCRFIYNLTQVHNVAIDNANSMLDDT